MMIKGCIYKLTNLVNGDLYFGQHNNVATVEVKRWNAHLVAAEFGLGSYVHDAIAFYDFQFSAEVVWVGPVEQLNWKEKSYIRRFHTFLGDPKYKGGYNLTRGGDGCYGYRHSEKSKKRMSAAQKLRFANIEERLKIATANTGKKQSPELVAKRIAAVKEYYASNLEAAEKRRTQLRSVAPKEHTAATRLILSLLHLGKPWSKKQRTARETPEYFQKASAGSRRGWAAKSPAKRKAAKENKRLAWAVLTAEERSRVGQKIWSTRRANGTDKLSAEVRAAASVAQTARRKREREQRFTA